MAVVTWVFFLARHSQTNKHTKVALNKIPQTCCLQGAKQVPLHPQRHSGNKPLLYTSGNKISQSNVRLNSNTQEEV